MDIESLLFRAASVPLGPFSMSYEAANAEAWALTVKLEDRTRTIRCEPEPRTGGLILSCPVNTAGAQAAPGPWVSSISPTADGKQELRIWLHGEGLSATIFIGALAELTRIAATETPEPQSLLEPVHIPIPIPTPPPHPDPVPVERPKPLDWQTFSQPAPADSTAPATPANDPVEATNRVPDTPTEASEPATPMEPVTHIDPVTPAVPVTSVVSGVPASVQPEVHHQPQPTEVVPIPSVSAEETKPPALAETKGIEEAVVSPSTAPPSSSNDERAPPADVPRVAGKAGICFECGSPYAADHAFCTNCGARLIPAGSN